MKSRVKLILFVALFIILWLPFIQQTTAFFVEPKLTGAFVKPSKPSFTWDSLNNLTYQKALEDFLNSDFGFRGFCVKTRNSVDNLLFNELSVADNVAGKEGHIFSRGAIEKTLGIQYNGKGKNDETVENIRKFKEDIEKRGGHFLVVIAPSKERTFPECVPAEYIARQKPYNNYSDFVEGYKKANIPFIDFCLYLDKLKDTCRYPVFTKTGFHWSMFAASYVQDSLVRYLEKKLTTPFPQYKRTGVIESDTAYESDADFEFSLNLFYKIGEKKYHYPKYEAVASTKSNYRPKVIVIGDSYFYQLKNQRTLKNIFSEESRFWFYFELYAYPLNDDAGIALHKDGSVIDELQSADYVILFSNLSTLGNFPYGVDEFYNANVNKPHVLQGIYEYIRSNPFWNKKFTTQTKYTDSVRELYFLSEAKSIYRNRSEIKIKASNNKYCCAGGDHEPELVAVRDEAQSWEFFNLYSLDNNEVCISSYKNKFLSANLANQNEIINMADKASDWEIFKMEKLEGGFVALKAFNGKYLSLDKNSGKLYAIATLIGESERLKLENIK